MKRRWRQDELSEMFTLTPSEHELVKGQMDHSRLGFAVQLKLFELNRRFPEGPDEVPREVARFLTRQLNVSVKDFDQYDWDGRTIVRHRRRIRELLGFQVFSTVHFDQLVQWLCSEVLPRQTRYAHLDEATRKFLEQRRLEQPSADRLKRAIRSPPRRAPPWTHSTHEPRSAGRRRGVAVMAASEQKHRQSRQSENRA